VAFFASVVVFEILDPRSSGSGLLGSFFPDFTESSFTESGLTESGFTESGFTESGFTADFGVLLSFGISSGFFLSSGFLGVSLGLVGGRFFLGSAAVVVVDFGSLVSSS